MKKKDKALNAIIEQKLLPLYYHDDAQVCKEILTALYNAGIRVVEFTNRGENALANFRILKNEAVKSMPGMLLGIGTIKTKKQAKKYIEEDADFIVSPSMNEGIAGVVDDLLWVPGCMTPTEIASAEECGAALVKIFPGNVLGPGYIKAVREIFPKLKFMPTGIGETDEESLKAWFKAGVTGIGMGSRLISKDLIDNKDFEEITNSTITILQLVRKVSDIK
jgi:2-dehydro-3-deoxyphosphogluconate aldolase/(4S)-4-hydroxy-2-oxoglutarate aldolase